MAGLKEVKERITSVGSTQQITKAMKMVAASKLRRAQDKILKMRPYSDKLFSVLERVSDAVGGEFENPYAVERESIDKVLIVVVSSDRGLCGGFNSNIIKGVRELIAEKYADQRRSGNVDLLCIGNKAYDHFRKRNFNVNSDFLELFHDLQFENAKEAAEYVMSSYTDGTYDRVEVIYNEFKNVVTQITRMKQFLPIVNEEDTAEETNLEVDYIFEPSQREILSELIPKSLKIAFYTFLLDSNAAEQGARMTAMDKATENAGEMLKELKLTYNRSRQAAITTEILEIVSGAEALSQA